jgi:hypothetical protein
MPDEVHGHVVAPDTALTIMAHLLRSRKALDVEIAKEHEGRAELLSDPTLRAILPRPQHAPPAFSPSWPQPCASRSSALARGTDRREAHRMRWADSASHGDPSRKRAERAGRRAQRRPCTDQQGTG